VIAEAAASDRPKRRYIVGTDAETIIGLHKRSTDEEFETAMRAVLGVPDSVPGAPTP
jgi:hypothetical protein